MPGGSEWTSNAHTTDGRVDGETAAERKNRMSFPFPLGWFPRITVHRPFWTASNTDANFVVDQEVSRADDPAGKA